VWGKVDFLKPGSKCVRALYTDIGKLVITIKHEIKNIFVKSFMDTSADNFINILLAALSLLDLKSVKRY